MSDGVVILHGIFRTHRSMAKLAKFFSTNGFKVLNVDYPSTRHDIAKLAEIIHPQIEAFSKTVEGRIHFIGYSMGGLIIRAYLHRFRPQKLGRVLLVATPNKGSEVADFIKDWRLYKILYGPAGQQLITDQTTFCNVFGDVNYELGVIAGNRAVDHISSWIIGKPNDGKVSVESACLPGMKTHVVIPANHTFFPNNKIMWRHALSFFQTGVL